MQTEGPCKTRRRTEVLPSESLLSFNKDRFIEIASVKKINVMVIRHNVTGRSKEAF